MRGDLTLCCASPATNMLKTQATPPRKDPSAPDRTLAGPLVSRPLSTRQVLLQFTSAGLNGTKHAEPSGRPWDTRSLRPLLCSPFAPQMPSRLHAAHRMSPPKTNLSIQSPRGRITACTAPSAVPSPHHWSPRGRALTSLLQEHQPLAHRAGSLLKGLRVGRCGSVVEHKPMNHDSQRSYEPITMHSHCPRPD